MVYRRDGHEITYVVLVTLQRTQCVSRAMCDALIQF